MTIARASRDSQTTSREASGDSETTSPEKLSPTVTNLLVSYVYMMTRASSFLKIPLLISSNTTSELLKSAVNISSPTNIGPATSIVFV